MRSFLRFLFIACLALATAGPHAIAEGDDALRNPQRQNIQARNPLEWLFGRPRIAPAPAQPAKRVYQPRTRTVSAPKPQFGPPMPPNAAPAASADPSAPQTADGAPAQPVVNLQFAVIGDSLAGMLGQGLQEIYADRPTITIHRRGRDSSGLVRDDYYDWPKAMRELLAANDKLDALVVMVGSNDRQQLRDEQGAYEPRTERWRELYAQRIDAIIGIARERKVPLVWVGMPVMRAERYSADMLAFNDIYRARTQQAGVPYVDVWEAFSTEQGEYSVTGPDVGGDVVRLRTGDGVHLTKAGARKLAFFADKELQKFVAAAQARLDQNRAPDAAVPAAPAVAPNPGGPAESLVMIPPPPETALPPALRTNDALLGMPMPGPPLLSTLRARPVAGPVVALTAPPVSAGGALAAARPAAPGGDAAARVFLEGRLPAAKAGRADDFRMP